MKNAEERAGFKIFWRKLWKWSLPCQNLQKPPRNNTSYLLCGFLRNWPIGIDENMLLNQGISKNQTSRWINFWRSWAKKFCGDGLCGCTIHLRILFYTKYYLCKKRHVRRAEVRASGYLGGFSESAPQFCTGMAWLKNHEFRARRPRNDAANGLDVLVMSLLVIRSQHNHRGPTRGRSVLKNHDFLVKC